MHRFMIIMTCALIDGMRGKERLGEGTGINALFCFYLAVKWLINHSLIIVNVMPELFRSSDIDTS